ncbi:MAG: hypothetical protein ABIM89_12100 [Mycobacteriales bacterium]
MAFGKGKLPQSYGVPVRAEAPAGVAVSPDTSVPVPEYATAVVPPAPWSAAPAAPWSAPGPESAAGGFYAPGPPAGSSPYAAPVASAPGWSAYGQQQFVPPFPLAPSPQKSGFRRILNSKPIAAVVIVLFVAGIGNAARGRSDARAAINFPPSLGGLTFSANAAAQKEMADAARELAAENPGMASGVGLYEESARGERFVMVIAVRGRLDEQRELRDAASDQLVVDRSSRREFPSHIVCYSVSNESATVCFVHGRALSILVADFGNADLAEGARVAGAAKKAIR